MSTDVATVDQPTRQAIEAQDRSAPGRVTGKLRKALDAMVWQGACRSEAAQTAGMADHSLRAALRKPHVKQHYLAELEVLRTSERARNLHTLVDVRDQKTNQMARVQAVKVLEQLDDDPNAPSRRGQAQVPGVTIQIVAGPQPVTINGTASAHEP